MLLEERIQLPVKICPKCKSRVVFIEDMPKVWLGFCKTCNISLVIRESLDKEPQTRMTIERPRDGWGSIIGL
jgi:hypothetical protein